MMIWRKFMQNLQDHLILEELEDIMSEQNKTWILEKAQ